MLQLTTKDPYEDGHADGHRRGYEDGWDAGYEAGKADAERAALTEEDLYTVILDDVLDCLIRYYRHNLPQLAEALDEVLRDHNHPSRIHDASPQKVKAHV